MATRRNAARPRRGALALVVAWVGLMGGGFLLAPGASAATTVPVHIKDLTPPLVSINAGDSVAFDDQIQDKTVQVGGGGGLLPSLVSAVVHTDVTLGIPDNQQKNQHVLKPGDPAFVYRFDQTCATCMITYTYRVTVPDSSITGSLLTTVTNQALAQMPQNQVVTYNGQQTTVTIGAPTPFLVNTLVPLPNLPGANLPQLPQLNLPNPTSLLPGTPKIGAVPGGTTQMTNPGKTGPKGIDGSLYAYQVPNGIPQMAPQGHAAPAFDPSRLTGGSSSAGSSGYAPGGSGGQAGTVDGASVPVFGESGSLGGANLADASAQRSSGSGSQGSALPVPALVAIVAMVGVVAALVRTHQARRAAGR